MCCSLDCVKTMLYFYSPFLSRCPIGPSYKESLWTRCYGIEHELWTNAESQNDSSNTGSKTLAGLYLQVPLVIHWGQIRSTRMVACLWMFCMINTRTQKSFNLENLCSIIAPEWMVTARKPRNKGGKLKRDETSQPELTSRKNLFSITERQLEEKFTKHTFWESYADWNIPWSSTQPSHQTVASTL